MDLEKPKKRESKTYELVIKSLQGRFKIYLTVGVNKDDKPIEIWLDCAKEGAMLRELMHAWASLFSIALQGGVPLSRMVKLYKPWGFEPCGPVDGFPGVSTCESVISLVVSILEVEFPKEAAPDEGQKTLFA